MTRSLVATLLVALLAVPLARVTGQAPIGAPAADSTRLPAALFVTWDGDPTTTVSIDWHLHAGTDLPTIAVRGPGLRGWRTVTGEPVVFPHSTRHVRRARITGLRPGATYRVRVADRTYTYRTMPARLDAPIVFAEGGDTQPDDATFGATNRMVARHDVAFALIGGDLAYSNGDPRLVAREERWFETVSRTLVTDQGRLIPVIAGIGNHEVFGARDTSAAFAEMIARTGVRVGDATYYRALHAHARERQHGVIDVGDYLSLVLLNTGHTMPIAGEQTEWLRTTLASRRAVPHLFPVYHVPGFPSVRAYAASNSAAVRAHWVPLFEEAGVRAAFEHHDHAYKRTMPIRAGRPDTSGVTYLGDGAWGAGPRPIGRDHQGEAQWYLHRTASTRHAIIVTLDRNSAHFAARDTTGAVIDSVRVPRRAGDVAPAASRAGRQ
ncbi:MAG: hypothetical protein MUF21_04010 [Gemmatimonadaceae bacterium]|nr:hypothetical protein [Gemmatimonadaceae bacterium]